MNIELGKIMRAIQQLLTVLALVATTSCATQDRQLPLLDSQQELSARMLLEDSPLVTDAELPDLSKINALELSPEMTAFLDKWVGSPHAEHSRLQGLLYAVMGDGTFELIYDDTTRTAQQTFDDQRGNCLSFTNMFVAMSRYLGLDTSFQEVMVPPDWSVKDQTYVLSRHINVHVDMDLGPDKVVDFNMYNFRTRYEMNIVSDQRGRAHYFNNIGVEHMLEGNILLAFANYRESLREDASFGPGWVNLGTLYSREGYPHHAETAFLKALDTDKNDLVAMNNLAALYEQQGRSELSAQYQLRIESHQMQNPYFRYLLAREVFDEGDYTTAIDHLKFAIRKNSYDDSFYFLMSLSYLNSGDKEAAQKWMKKAEEVAEMETDKKRYNNKLDLLMSNEPGS